MGTISVWAHDDTIKKIQDILERNIQGYSDEYLESDNISRVKTILLRKTQSAVAGELLNLGMAVFESAISGNKSFKLDMLEYWETLLLHVLRIESLIVNEEVDFDSIQKDVNKMFRGDEALLKK